MAQYPGGPVESVCLPTANVCQPFIWILGLLELPLFGNLDKFKTKFPYTTYQIANKDMSVESNIAECRGVMASRSRVPSTQTVPRLLVPDF